MNRVCRITATVAALALFVTAAPLFAGEDHEAEMAKWMEVAAPGPHHAHMKEWIGTWDVKGKMWMDPAQPPAESSGTAEFRLALGGRFLEQRMEGISMGMPMEGIGFSGFDNLAGKHISFWIDTWGTLMMTTEGSCADHCSVITETGSYPDIMTGGTKNYKMVIRKVSKDEAKLEMFDVAGDGSETRTMELIYTRSGS